MDSTSNLDHTEQLAFKYLKEFIEFIDGFKAEKLD